MFEDIFSRRNIILQKLINYFFDDDKEIILESMIKIKDLSLIFRSIVLFSKKIYVGLYSLEHRKKLNGFLLEGKKEEFIKNFTRYNSNFIRNNKLEQYVDLEVLTVMYFYEKQFYNSFFEFNETNYNLCKKKIYLLHEKDIRNRYFTYKNIIMVKKGKEETQLNLQETIYQIIKNKKVDYNVKKYIQKFYSQEYNIVYDYLKYHKEIYF
jgi:hypothetical protein